MHWIAAHWLYIVCTWSFGVLTFYAGFRFGIAVGIGDEMHRRSMEEMSREKFAREQSGKAPHAD